MSDSLIGNLLVASSLIDDPVMSQAVCLIVHQDENQTIGVMLNRPIQPNPKGLLQMLKSTDAKPESQNRLASNESPSKSDTVQTKSKQTDDDSYPLMKSAGNELSEQPKEDSVPDEDSKAVQDSQAERTLAQATAALGTVHFGGPLNGPVVAIHSSSEFAEAETGRGIYVAAQKPNLEGLVRCQEAPYRLIVGHIGWDNQQLQAELNAGIWHAIPATADAVFSLDREMWPRLVRRATARSVANWIGTTDVPMAYEVN